MWIVPAFCALSTAICVIIDFALKSQLSGDKALQGLSLGPAQGQSSKAATNGTVSAIPSGIAANGTVPSAAIAASGTVPIAPTAPPIPSSSTVSINLPPGVTSIPAGVPAKLSLRALSNSTIAAVEPTPASSAPKVTVGGALYL
jgi:hypothetical protein